MRLFQTLAYNTWRGACRVMNALKHLFWKNKKIALIFFSGLILNIISWGILYWLYSTGRPGLVIHYNAFLGIDIFRYLGEGAKESIDVFITPFGGICFYFINIIISISLFLLSPASSSQAENIHQPKKIKSETKEELDVYKFGIYIIISGNIIVQAAILVYAIAIYLVNQ